MNFEEFAADLVCPTIVCSSVEENEETMAVFDVEQYVRQLGKGKFRSHLAVRSVGDIEFFADRFSTAFSAQFGSPKGEVGLMIPRSASGRFLASGENLGDNKLVFVTEHSGSDIIVPALGGSDDVGIPTERFAERMATLCPTVHVPEQSTIYAGDAQRLHAIQESIVKLLSTPNTPCSEETVSNLVDSAIAWLGESTPYRGPEPLSIDPERLRVARKAQEYIEEHYDDCVRIEDLCREAGTGVRTLQRCFRDYFDVTISEYLKTKRLDAAHRELGDAHLNEHTVTEIAMNHGFNHLGRFSVDFRERFGESPRKTLATREGQKSVAREIPASVFLASANFITSIQGD